MLEIDLDEFGTPGWLTPLGKFDPAYIRKKNHEAWLAAHRPKFARDAGFDPNQDRDQYGRWTQEGSGTLGKKAEWIRQKIDTVADELKFPKDRIFMSKADYKFSLNGANYRAAGVAINSNDGWTIQSDVEEKYAKGDIVIFGEDNTKFDEDFPVRGLVAHEIQHQMFNQVLDAYSAETGHLYNHNPDKMDITNFRAKPEVLEDIKNAYPTIYALESLGWDSDAFLNKLEEEDGVTWYSKQYWDQAGAHKPGSRKLAINETLAEIASLTQEGEAKIWTPETGAQMTEHLRGWLKSQYEKDGSSFAEPDEHAAQMADPWAYAEMMEDTDGDDEFRKKFGTKLHNIRGIGGDGMPRYSRPVWTDYPDPVISPTWKKLFDTFRAEYKRINMIKDGHIAIPGTY